VAMSVGKGGASGERDDFPIVRGGDSFVNA